VARRLEIPARTEIDVRLLTALDPATARTGDRVEASTVAELIVNQRIVVPAASLLRGVVMHVIPQAAEYAHGSLAVTFDYLTVNFRAHAVSAAPRPAINGVLPAGAVLRHPVRLRRRQQRAAMASRPERVC
jgi:hypothetical protein